MEERLGGHDQLGVPLAVGLVGPRAKRLEPLEFENAASEAHTLTRPWFRRTNTNESAAGLGLEPRYTPSKGVVLPLDDPAIIYFNHSAV